MDEFEAATVFEGVPAAAFEPAPVGVFEALVLANLELLAAVDCVDAFRLFISVTRQFSRRD